ncbi:hypothetical protein ABEP17_10825 [Priestia flexa]|uniref:hypothetical protein n=1 Tax=Priestia flexa TaxID=86664 RepID=UPI003D2970A7
MNLNDTIRTEGARTYLCPNCNAFFALVTPLVPDIETIAFCPRCKEEAHIYGEGHLNHRQQIIKEDTLPYNESDSELKNPPLHQNIFINEQPHFKDQFPYVMNSQHIQEILDIGKEKAYELMEEEAFPVLRIGRHKKVVRDKFFQWLDDPKTSP